jgi:hypothetical protein
MLAALGTVLVGIHALGALVGAGGVTFAEVAYSKAIADGKIVERERDYFHRSYWALRWGMTTVLLSGIALIVVQYLLPDSPEAVLYAPLWMQNSLALIITASAWFMTRKYISWWLGSSIAFAGWWMLLILDAFALLPLSYLVLLFVYVFAVFLSAGFWGYVRTILHERAKMKQTTT